MGDLATEQRALVETVRDFAQTELAPHALEWDQAKHFPVDTLHRAGELGLGGICVAEDVGGLGLTHADAVLIFEELAAGDPSIAAYISIHNMVVGMIDQNGTDEQRRRFVPALAAMQSFASFCLTEPGAGSDSAALTTSAVRDGDEYVLNGVKQFTSGAGSSSVYFVLARTGEAGATGISAILVPLEAPGLSFGANERKMGWNAQPTRQVIFENVRVPVGNRIGAEGAGFAQAMRGLSGGRINIGACSVGGGQWALDKTVRRLADRQAFGRPLAAQEALVFEIADRGTDLQTARLLLRHAAQALDAEQADATVLCAMAKRHATDAGFAAANAALQLHGGYGYLAEYGIEKVVRDLRVHQIVEGANEIMRLIVGRALLDTP
ncbi:acyl-CoA dehydrogenase family protein [Salinibacterium sp. ZJ454]|uniref:acyl-CoA dehydrogenase family protein n=1 Tax=Salinibacterium sp. ZJ454 TaxID=2708339 RepID=UPI0014213CAF|nr:acyl-CoA dehydrogenase family protein [Salinibacterium sp. ZJ454]